MVAKARQSEERDGAESSARGRAWRRLRWFLVAVGLALVVYLLVAPTRVEPAAWPSPPAAPLEGEYAPNDALQTHTAIAIGIGPEDVAVGPDGRLFTGLADGRVLAVADDGSTEIFHDTGGRPLGLAFAPDGALWIADARRGLLRVDRSGTLLGSVEYADDGSAIGLADELVIADDGSVWFTDASARWDVQDSVLDALENRATGRVLHHDPAAGTTAVKFDGLRFANGIVLAADQQSLLVSETFAYRITRLWIAGPQAGTREVFAGPLPGFVDNLDLDADGTLWVGIPSLRSGLLDALLPHPWARRVLSRIPMALQPVPAPYGMVIGLGVDGRPRFNLQDPTGGVHAITSATPIGDELVLGSLHAGVLVRIRRPRPT